MGGLGETYFIELTRIAVFQCICKQVGGSNTNYKNKVKMKKEWKKDLYCYSSSTTKECYSIYIQKEWSIKKATYKESPEAFLGVSSTYISTSFSCLSLEVGESLRNSVIPPLLVLSILNLGLISNSMDMVVLEWEVLDHRQGMDLELSLLRHGIYETKIITQGFKGNERGQLSLQKNERELLNVYNQTTKTLIYLFIGR